MRYGTLTASALRSVLSYDPKTGIFVWEKATGRRNSVGQEAGFISNNRRSISVYGQTYSDYRLAWLHYYGEWPSGNVSHINGDIFDCRIENLKIETASATAQRGSLRSTNLSGLKGVSWCSAKNKWQATITKEGTRYHLGYFKEKEEAAQAYNDAASGIKSPERGSAVKDRRQNRWRLILWNKVLVAYDKNIVWQTAEDFYNSVGKISSADAMIFPIRPDEPVGPDNFIVGTKIIKRPDCKRYREKNTRRSKDIALQKTFGISIDQYEDILSEQGHVCAICKQPETALRGEKIKALAVDHDHTTGKIRGALCQSCNIMLGKAKESSSILLNAAAYLEKYSTP